MTNAFTVSTRDATEATVDVLVVPVWANRSIAASLPDRIKRELAELMKRRDWNGSWGSAAFFVQETSFEATFVALVGLGDKEQPRCRVQEGLRRGVGIVMNDAKRHGLSTLGVVLFEVADASALARAAVEGALLASYSYTEFSRKLAAAAKRQALGKGTIFVAGKDAATTRKALQPVEAIVSGTALARTLVNRPAGHMSPKALVEESRRIAKRAAGFSVTVFNRAQAKKRNFTAFLAVAQGSQEEPYVIHLKYLPRGTKQKRKKVFLIGKGITFDSGGLSLKPADYMEDMKTDMAGSATVLGVFQALAELKPDVEVHGVILACENMPSGTAYRPGDVVTAKNGKTIEVLNTDAEGRITLADALSYASDFKPDAIIDVATLTGASMVGLGETIAGMWGGDSQLLDALREASEESGERVAELPMPEEYQSLLESTVADLRNVATSRYGGGITAAMFLREFVGKDIPWAHLDTAGPSYYSQPYISYLGKGASGFGVRMLVQYLLTLRK